MNKLQQIPAVQCAPGHSSTLANSGGFLECQQKRLMCLQLLSSSGVSYRCGGRPRRMQRKAAGTNPFPPITQLHQPHLFCYFIESGRSLSMFLKTKPIVFEYWAKGVGIVSFRKFPPYAAEHVRNNTGTFSTPFATAVNSNLKSSRGPCAGLQPLPSPSPSLLSVH